ncbi:MAG: hypothetical protein LBN27_03900 [Prevotellaceae bacterium]|jgi:hypothetical protein|nr:hypothetical protein [Prevotellaceae bacterium]
MEKLKEIMLEKEQESFERKLSDYLGISYEEFTNLLCDIDTEESSDGLIYNYIVKFNSDDNSEELLSKIRGINTNKQVVIPSLVFDQITK